jgi:hypothetical protein
MPGVATRLTIRPFNRSTCSERARVSSVNGSLEGTRFSFSFHIIVRIYTLISGSKWVFDSLTISLYVVGR